MDEIKERRWQRRLKNRDKARKLGLDDFVKAAAGTRQGRDYLWWVMEIANIGRNPHTANALNTAFNCGQMNVGQQVQAHLMSVSPDGYLNMLKEREKERVDAEREYDELNSDSGNAASGEDNDDDSVG